MATISPVSDLRNYNTVLDKVEEKHRGMGAIICTCPQPNLLRDNLLQLPVWYI